jgi:hypothetical protein
MTSTPSAGPWAPANRRFRWASVELVAPAGAGRPGNPWPQAGRKPWPEPAAAAPAEPAHLELPGRAGSVLPGPQVPPGWREPPGSSKSVVVPDGAEARGRVV